MPLFWTSIVALHGVALCLLLFLTVCRARRAGGNPCCARCGYEPGGRAGEAATCPECAWQGPLEPGPLRRPRKRIAATALLLLAFCLVGVWPLIRPALLMTGADVYRLIPDRAVVVLAAGGNERALEESADRVVAASLSPKAESRLIDALLDFQADPTRPLHGATADALLVAFDAGRMTPAQAVRYVRDAQRAEFETQSVVRPGDPWQSYGFHVKGRPPETAGPARLRRQNRSQTVEAALKRAADTATRRVRLTGITIDGRPADTHLFDSTASWAPWGHGHMMAGRLPLPPRDATHPWEIVLQAEVTIERLGVVIAQWTVTERWETRFAGPGEPVITVIQDEDTIEELVGGLNALRLDVEAPRKRGDRIASSSDQVATLYLWLETPAAHPAVGPVEIVTAEGSFMFNTAYWGLNPYAVPKLIHPTAAGPQSIPLRTAWNSDDANGALAFWEVLRRQRSVDVILHSDPDAAIPHPRLGSVLDLSVRFSGVPVRQRAPVVMNVPYTVDQPSPPGVPAERVHPAPHEP